jgi:hypothetical protein
MNFRFIAFVFLLISLSARCAEELPTFCLNESIASSPCNQKQIGFKLNTLPKEIEEYGYINQQIQNNFKINELTKFSLAELNQSLTKGNDPRVEKLYAKFSLLAYLTAELKSMHNKYDICFKNCSRTRLVEIADDIKKIEKARMSLLMSEPLLTSEYFEEIIADIKSDNLEEKQIVGKEQFNKALHKTLDDNLKTMNDKRSEYLDYFKTLNSNTIHEKNQEDIVKNHPMIMKEVLITQSLNHKQLDPNQVSIICKKYKEFIQQEKKETYTGYAIDTALFILPLLSGPLFPLAEDGMLIAVLPRLSRFGMSRETTILKDFEVATGLGADIVGLGKAAGDQVTYLKNCQRSEIVFLQNPKQESLEKVRKCQNNRYTDLLLSEVGAVAGIGSLGNNTRNAILQIRSLAP